jgi:hypothetical protein
MRRLLALPIVLLAAAPASAQVEAPAREHEPVVLEGAQLAGWAAPNEQTARLPLMDFAEGGDPHNTPREPQVTTAGLTGAGTPVDRLHGFRWEAGGWVPVPFQVDERFTRYLNNTASGFALYSGEDRHTTYAFDREGWRWHGEDPKDPCQAVPVGDVTPDPVAGLDFDDELAFMARDAGAQAPAGAALPKGGEAAKEVRVVDASTQTVKYLYVVRGDIKDRAKPYVRYERDKNADTYERSQSSYSDYGNARRGTVCDAKGNVVGTNERRRPRDTATITTPRYEFRYDGRWLMTRIGVSEKDDWRYGRDLVDRWKARAFQQDPSSETPCCGYEEEDTNWGGSSTLLGERVGPVRAIRETWGADSGTNVIRRETFYRDTMDQRTYLRVHPIPPLDGIYAQWDFNAGAVTTFRSARRPDGVPIDGRNDEAFGNLDDPCNGRYDANDTSDLDQQYRSIYRTVRLCDISPYHQSVDLADPTFSDANAALGWTQTSGPAGTIVDRIQTVARELTPGGAAQSLAAVPYYRDDACFDDGTGSDPGPRIRLRSKTEELKSSTGEDRRCWRPEDGEPGGSDRFFQGSIGTHGLHLLLVGESDNGRLTVPTTEIVSDWKMVMLPGDPGNVGERYGRSFEKPLVAVVTDAGVTPAAGRATLAR